MLLLVVNFDHPSYNSKSSTTANITANQNTAYRLMVTARPLSCHWRSRRYLSLNHHHMLQVSLFRKVLGHPQQIRTNMNAQKLLVMYQSSKLIPKIWLWKVKNREKITIASVCLTIRSHFCSYWHWTRSKNSNGSAWTKATEMMRATPKNLDLKLMTAWLQTLLLHIYICKILFTFQYLRPKSYHYW